MTQLREAFLLTLAKDQEQGACMKDRSAEARASENMVSMWYMSGIWRSVETQHGIDRMQEVCGEPVVENRFTLTSGPNLALTSARD